MVEMRPGVVLLSAATGYGHVAAGQALASSIRDAHPGWSVHHDNIGCYLPPLQRWLLETRWNLMSTAPVVRNFYSVAHRRFTASDQAAVLATALFRGAAAELERKYDRQDVRAVIALHPAAAMTARIWKQRRNFHFSVVATDLVVHSFQAFPEVDLLFCDRASELRSLNVHAAHAQRRLRFTGLPVEAEFFRKPSLPESGDRPQVLVSFGAQGLRAINNLDKILSAAERLQKVRWVLICGRDTGLCKRAEEAVRARNLEMSVSVVGFCADMPSALSSSTVIVGKPGGLTVGEALVMNKPMVIIDYLPGQEEYNLQYLLRCGLGCVADSPDSLVRSISGLLQERRAPFAAAIPGQASGVSAICELLCEALHGARTAAEEGGETEPSCLSVVA